MLKEQVAKVIDKAVMADMIDGRFGSKPYAQEILNLFKAGVDKLTVIDDGEVENIFKGKIIFASSPETERQAVVSLTTQAQLQHTKKELLDLMG